MRHNSLKLPKLEKIKEEELLFPSHLKKGEIKDRTVNGK